MIRNSRMLLVMLIVGMTASGIFGYVVHAYFESVHTVTTTQPSMFIYSIGFFLVWSGSNILYWLIKKKQ